MRCQAAGGKAITSRILILAGDTDGNLGDLAIVTATCAALKRLAPEATIALVTGHAERDRRRLGIVPLPRTGGLGALLREARRADLVLCGGGGLFQDDDSLVKMPYWAARLTLLHALTRRIAGFSIGAGPLEHPASRLFARAALRALEPVTVRDPLARAALAPLTDKPVTVVPDPAFMLEAAPAPAAAEALAAAGVPAGKPLVGVALRRWFHKGRDLLPYKYAAMLGLRGGRGRAQMAALVERTAATLDRVLAASGAHAVFLPTYNVPHENDAEVCAAIARRMRSAEHTLLVLDDPGLYKAVAGRMTVMLCGRMHPAILAAGQGTPVVGLSYNPKFAGTFALLGQAERCMPLATLLEEGQPERLEAMLLETLADPERYRPDTLGLANATRAFLGTLLERPVAEPAPATRRQDRREARL